MGIGRIRLPAGRIPDPFAAVADAFDITWTLHRSDKRAACIMVSKQAHCLYDILAHHESGEWPADIVQVISITRITAIWPNATACHSHTSVTPDTKATAEAQQIERSKAGTDVVVLARYMQILSPAFVQAFPTKIINIHHSFLPAFAGGRPYHAAHERGVKIIGATAHYVTAELDEGPIIEQDVIRVSHRQGVDDLVRLGRDLEKVVLSRAIYWHLHHRLLVYKNRTVVFA